jgi:hypothetical protein
VGIMNSIYRSVLATFLIVWFTTPAFGIATYTYTGNNYAVVTAPFTTSMHVSGSFSVADPLAADLPLTDIEGDLLAFTFSDGVTVYTLANAVVQDMRVGTDSAGNIDEWQIVLLRPFPTPTDINDRDRRLSSSAALDQGSFRDCLDEFFGECTTLGPLTIGETLPDQPGSWDTSVSSVPEPGTLLLVSSGLAGLSFRKRFVRRKKV